MTEKNMNVTFNIDDGGEAFFAHELSTQAQPTQICLDFKNISPRLDSRNQEGNAVVFIKHNVIIADPWMIKDMARVINETLEKYEKLFGKIERPRALEKFDKLNKTSYGGEATPTYFG